ncbi:hypothetical protein PVAP13_7KG029100 [Panicum virgatum]|uniref:Uncharacterized protein n=2 Tax=Panicum virgatum TaxID=38727 RepID=A0A8T0QAJ0_PANVG|nr:hypothetical protein PVAP13_7KG029100 [Panicum virgatum]
MIRSHHLSSVPLLLLDLWHRVASAKLRTPSFSITKNSLLHPFHPPNSHTISSVASKKLRFAKTRSWKSWIVVTMMAMGYFRAPRRLYGRKPERGQHRESLSAALLVDEGEAAAAAGAVPKGYFAVYIGAEARRFVVPTSYLSQPAFRELMERAAEEFGFDQAGGLRIPCREEDFQATVAALEESRRRGGGRRTNAVGSLQLI